MSSPAQTSAPNPVAQLLQTAMAYMPAVCLYSAAKLKVADELANGPKPVEDLAQATGASPDALYRTLRALASTGIFRETAPRVFANTPASESLRAEVPGSVRDAVLWLANGMHMRVYGDFLHSVRSGGTAIERVTGASAFSYFQKQENREDADTFNQAMTNFSALFAGPVLEAYDFSGIGTLADIAGGHGFFLASILRKHPDLRGILFEMPYVEEAAKKNLAALGVAARCELICGDFFKEVPAADAYVMKSIIHDWDDEKAVAILKNCARAMRGNGKVILVELLVTPGNDADLAKWIDLEMLAMAGGRERTEAEYAELFSRAGLRLAQVVRSKAPYCVIEAVRA